MAVTFLPLSDPSDHTETTPDQLPDFVLIPTADIEAVDRLRPIDPLWASALGQMMLREGQDTPIQVCRLPGRDNWRLVVGGHRHAGAIDAGIELMRAEIVGAGKDDRRLREVRENLWRAELAPIDRAAFIAEMVQIKRAQAGLAEAAQRDARLSTAVKAEAAQHMETISMCYGFTEEVGVALRMTGRTIRNDLLLYRGLAPSLVARLRAVRHPSLANATHLRSLAKLDEHSQAKVVELLLVPSASLNYGQPTTIPEAITHKLGPKPAAAKPAADDKRLSAFIGAFQRMGLAEKKGALAQLAGLLPTGFQLSEGPVDA